MVNEVRYIGRVHVSAATILDMLNLQGGTLMNVELDTINYPPGYDFMVEHPSMPEVRDGGLILVVEHDREAPIYTDG